MPPVPVGRRRFRIRAFLGILPVMTNAEIAQAFERIALILDLKGGENPFRIRAYERAAVAIANMGTDLRELYGREGLAGLDKLPGIGKDLALKIQEMIQTGRLAYLEEVQRGLPAGLLDVLEVEGMGPKRTKFVWEKFKVRSIEDLKALAESGKLTALKGWGEKSVQNILRGIAQRGRLSGRLPLTKAEPLVRELLDALRATGLVDRMEAAGSFRRRRETVGDIDILATSRDPAALMDAFVQLPQAESVTAKGETKSTVFLTAGLDCDLRVVPEEVYGAALLYFTGSKDHNVRLRKMGISRNLTLNEYGMFRGTAAEKGELVAALTEEDVYRALDLPWIPPELREDRGEIQEAERGRLPALIEQSDVKADLHIHTTFSDGKATLEQMVEKAAALGYAYVAITDHASVMGMVQGIKPENFRQYLANIIAVREKFPGIRILAGAEVDILEDGTLYLADDLLAQLDWVVASVHQNFRQDRKTVTDRIIRAIQNPYVHTIGHPTARMLGRREGVDVDLEAVMRAAAETGTALELNASYDRLDLNDVHLKRARELGVMITIGSDAHSVNGFDLTFGISQARRGWLEAKNVVNCLPPEAFERWRTAKRR